MSVRRFWSGGRATGLGEAEVGLGWAGLGFWAGPAGLWPQACACFAAGEGLGFGWTRNNVLNPDCDEINCDFGWLM